MATRFELAFRAWPMLIRRAKVKETITYEDLANELGYSTPRVTRFALWPLQDYCMEKELPPLTSIVIQKRTGIPGPGFVAWEGNIADAHDRVFAFPWTSIPRPFPPGTSLTPVAKGLKTKRKKFQTQNSYDVPDSEVVVNGRGPYQTKFRARLLSLYRNCCALCDTKHPRLLVASHIIPWSQDSKHRLDPSNGLLLCRTHDALFECSIIRVLPTFDVEVKASSSQLGSDAEAFLLRHTATRLRVPVGRFKPNPAFLQWRYVMGEPTTSC